MNTLYLLRHSLTEANERHLYGGSTDLPLSEKGRAIAAGRADALPDCDLHVTSGMRRTDETLWLVARKKPDVVLPGLREMDFGAFEMKSYEDLKALPEYVRWIGDAAGEVRCPGGECRRDFLARVLAAGQALLNRPEATVCAVCHGGVIVGLMEAWFPETGRHFYQWQPGPCGGYRITVEGGRPSAFEEV